MGQANGLPAAGRKDAFTGEVHGDEEVYKFAYRPKYLAFIEVRGVSALARAGDTDPAIRRLILGIVAILRETLARNPRAGLQFMQFSDCIVISANCEAFGQRAVVSGCRMLATDLLCTAFCCAAASRWAT